MADSNVNIRINAQNTASPVIKQVNSDLSKMDKAAGTAAGGLSSLGKVIGAAGLVTLGVQVASAAVELANLGNQSIAMRASFEQLAGGAENASNILESLQQASRGTISSYDLMLSANRAMLLGVADTSEELGQLMQIASARGKAMGLSVGQAFSDIITGLGRMSPLILDNLGIVVDQQKAQDAYAATLNKTAAQLTDAERKQALVNDVIANSADLLRDANSNAKVYAGEGMAQLGTAWAEFRTALGESLGPLFDARAKDVADGIAKITAEMGKQNEGEALRASLSGTRGTELLAGISDPGSASAILRIAIENTKKDLDAANADYVAKASNAQAEIAAIYASTPGLSRVQAGEIFQSELDAITGNAIALQAELAKLEGAFDRLNGTIAETKSVSSNLGALSDATRPDVSVDQSMLAMQSQIQAMLDMVQAANASLGEAMRQGNTEAADVAKSYVADLAPAIRVLVGQYNDLAEAQGRQRITGISYGNAEIIYQTVDALEAEKKAAEDVATALTIIGESDGKLQGLYDTLLDTGNIDGAAASFEAIKGVIADITTEWVSQGKSVEEIQGTLLPKLISEIDRLIGEQIAAGDAGITAGELIGSGFLSSLPGIDAVIAAVSVLTGNVIAAGNAINAVQGFNLNAWQWKELGATGVRPPGLIGPAPRGVEKPRPGLAPIDNSGFGWFGAAADTFGGKTAADLQSERIRALAQNQRNLAAAASGGSGGGGGGSVDNEAQKLANRLTSILNGALKSGINLDEILGRPDAIEEPARRLADIAVRGFESPWVQYFKDQFPEIWSQIESSGDPKRAAASILKDFEDGLRPELLDKNRAKELVRRALLGESNISTLASEIAAELATEMGVSLEQAQQAAAGILGTGGVGTDSATGMDGGTAATAFTDSFIGVMSGMLERFKGAGQSAGSQWGVGFMTTVEAGVPGQLIGLLVSLVTPAVMANLAANGSRTGAS